MQRLLLPLVFVLMALCAAQAGDGPKASTDEMKEKFKVVIGGQLEAFRKDDYESAYHFAAKAIQEQFPVAAFEKMVRDSYPIIAKNQDAVFGLSVDDGEKAIVNVRVVAQDKSSSNYQYLLQREGDEWRITGVFLLRENEPPI